MKILAICGSSAVDQWRITRPIEQLKQHTDLDIDVQANIIRDYHGLDTDPDKFLEEYGAAEARHLGQYDIVFASYSNFLSPHVFTILWGAKERYGTKLIMDVDDDVFDVDPSNFSYWKAAGHIGHSFLQTSVELAEILCVTNERLAGKIKEHTAGDPTFYVIDNYMSESYPDQTVDNGDKVVIGFFGGSSHYNDLHKSGVLSGLQRLMHEHKEVYFKTCGLPVDYYLPKARVEVVDPVKPDKWIDMLMSLKLDISIAPLLDTEFNKYKSAIKAMEATRAGAAVVCSDMPPYKDFIGPVLTENDGNAWYNALKELVEDVEKRKALVKEAKDNMPMLETNYTKYVDMFTDVAKT